MAMGSKGTGSTVSLHTFHGDTIPKEYHRKVLKKIAQLTKVIYNLHTKNDEKEEELETLSAQYAKEKQLLTNESDSRLKKCEEERMKTETINSQLELLVKEKDKLVQEHATFVSDAEKRFHSIREQQMKKIHEMSSDLEMKEQQLSTREKECDRLKKMCADLETKMAEKDEKASYEINEVRRVNEKALNDLQTKYETEHELYISSLHKKHSAELNSLKSSMKIEKDSFLHTELKEWDKKFENLQKEFSSKESGLSHQISNLSSELSKTKDQLVLTQQRERELERQVLESEKEEVTLRGRLEEKEAEIEEMERKLKLLNNECSIITERCDQQSQEMKKMAAHVGELEALRTHYESISQEFQSQVQSLTEKLQYVQNERDKVKSSHKMSSDESTQRIKTLEKEVEQLGQEKQQLRAQYALEIEAVHSQLSERETNLVEDHLRAIQELKNNHKLELEASQSERIDLLRASKENLESKMLAELSALDHKKQEELDGLSRKLSSKKKEFENIKIELNQLKAIFSEKERDLGSAEICINQLRSELIALKHELDDIKRERDKNKSDNTQLQMSLDAIRRKYDESLVIHRDELNKTQMVTKNEIEELWTSRLRCELSSQSEQLEQHYAESNRTALNKMADLKNAALKDFKDNWNTEKEELLQRIKLLEKELLDLQCSSEAALRKAHTESHKQIEILREELGRKLQEATQIQEELVSGHVKDTEALKQSYEEEKHLLNEQFNAMHKQDLQECHRANQLAITTLRNELERKGQKEIENLQREHQHELVMLQDKLNMDHELILKETESQYNSTLHAHQKEVKQLTDNFNHQLTEHEHIRASMEQQLASYKDDLLKEKEKVSLLVIEVSSVKKELEVKHQELVNARKEAKDQLRLQEQQFNSTHHVEMESLQSQYKHQSQIFLNEFNKAKELLNRKLHDAERKLFEAEQRYRNREPRPEDLEQIRELKFIVREQEQKIKEIIAEKRIYQLELMNREKNYNKLFSASPQIGVLDPLQIRRKAVDSITLSSSTMRHSSAPSLASSNEFLPTIQSSNTFEKRQHHHKSPTLHHHTNTTPLKHNFTSSDYELLPGLVPSPTLSHHNHMYKSRSSTIQSSPLPSRHRLKFLSSGGDELDDSLRTNASKKIGTALDNNYPQTRKSVIA